MTKDYNEIILQAVDTVITARLDGLSFDKTIKCTITDDKQKSEGKYIVSDGAIKMEAYCDTVDKYVNGDQVYVTVPQGDYSQKKIIVSKFTENDNTAPTAYVPPLSTMMDMSGDILATIVPPNKYGLVANGKVEELPLYEIDLTTSKILPSLETKLYDTIGLSADFQTLLTDKDLQRGKYGLRIDLTTDDGNVWTTNWSSDFMFGNPYMFSIPLQQTLRINKGEKIITKIKIGLYQDNNFQYYDALSGQLLRYPSTIQFDDNKEKQPNIKVTNIKMIFGQDLAQLQDNTIDLYTHDNEEYTRDNNTKKIYSTWINKDIETNEFIGFSDGIVDEKYDEESYMREYEEDWLGGSTVIEASDKPIPDLRESLQIYSNAKQITQELKKLEKYIDTTTYLKGYLDSLDRNLQAYAVNSETLGFITQADTGLTSLLQKAVSALKGSGEVDETYTIEKQYIDRLQGYYNAEQELQPAGKNNKEINFSTYKKVVDDTITSLTDAIAKYCDPKVEFMNTLFQTYPNIKAYVEQVWQSFKQVLELIDETRTRLDGYINEQDPLIKALDKRLPADAEYENKLAESANITSFREEYEAFRVANENRYCIYWYRYNKDYEDIEDKIGEKHWKRIAVAGEVPGMPATEEAEMGRKYQKFSNTPLEITDLNPEVEEERIKMILYYNHARFTKEIVLKNTSETSASKDGDLTGALYIELGSSLDDASAGKSYSMESHQLYNSYYTLMKASDGYINRKIRLRFDGVQGKDEMLAGTRVFWYIPNQATMLTYDETRLANEGFSHLQLPSPIPTDDDGKEIIPDDYKNYHLPGYECFYKYIDGIESSTETDDNGEPVVYVEVADTFFWYQIAKIYNPALTNNELLCKVVKDDDIYTTSQLFTFSTYGNNGTDYTLSIIPAELQGAVIGILNSDKNTITEKLPLKLKAQFSDYNGEEITDGVITWSLETTAGTSLVHNQSDEVDIRSINIADSVTTLSEMNLYNILKASTRWDKINSEVTSNETLTLTAVYPIPYSSGHYYIDGASTVIYNDQGTNPQYYNGAYKIYNISNNEEKTDVYWTMYYYNNNGYMGPNNQTTLYNKELPYLPRIVARKEGGYKLSPLTMYISNQTVGCVAVCFENETNKILYAQPIYIGQNRYGSPMLNTWDESLIIDEDNNTIMSAMLGAGYKDENNAFHGVLMGRVGEKAGFDSYMNTGIYGFHAGAQSFAWKIDGTGFIGKSGQGRIEFDGNNGTITSGNYSTNDTLGMKIDLESGHIDAYNFKLTSNGIKLNSNPSNSQYYINIGDNTNYIRYGYNSNGVAIMNISSDSFKLESGNSSDGQIIINSNPGNYYLYAGKEGSNIYISKSKLVVNTPNFTLDGSNVSMTGSIVAKSGSIGGWTISENGLFKGNNYSEATVGMSANQTDWAFWAGGASKDTAKFRVDQSGNLYATNATIVGDITATSGTFTGTIYADYGEFGGTLESVSGNFNSLTANGNLYLTGNKIYFSSSTTSEYIQYTSDYGGAIIFYNLHLYIPGVYAYGIACNSLSALGASDFPTGGTSSIAVRGGLSIPVGATLSLHGHTLGVDEDGWVYAVT